MTLSEDEQSGNVSTLNITLGELVVFINWMQQAEQSISQGQPLPLAPPLTLGEVSRWVNFVLKQESIIRECEDKQRKIQEMLNVQEQQLGSLVNNLCDQIAVLYENLEKPEKAARVRLHLSESQSP